jgi:hypothetical protein
MKKKFPKVLIAAPTASVKGYCFQDWLDHCLKLKYPNFDIRLFDNTVGDHNEYTHKCNSHYVNNYGHDEQFRQIQSLSEKQKKQMKEVGARMAISHDDCRKYALKHGYDYLLHLESDVFPELDIIERLIANKKKVVGAMYYTSEGIYRSLVLQRKIFRSPHNIVAENFKAGEDVYFADGTVKKIASVGLGCVLIHKSVLKQIPFRHDPAQDVYPDSLFSSDCFEKGISIFVDTSLVCEHRNKAWHLLSV